MAITLDDLYTSSEQSYLITAHLDKLYLDGKFVEINDWIQAIDISKLTSSGLRSACVTISWHLDKLDYAIDFYRKAYIRMEELQGKELAKRLLWFVLEKI